MVAAAPVAKLLLVIPPANPHADVKRLADRLASQPAVVKRLAKSLANPLAVAKPLADRLADRLASQLAVAKSLAKSPRATAAARRRRALACWTNCSAA